ncbi:MAG: hypothetical protein NTZ46_08575 [Verrucomicrobia bacterium]|nr:hypothetical protein [Verrucomicrobiota bacterium]
MKCIHCEEEARAVCKFCGHAVCKEHIQQGRFVSGYTTPGHWLSRTANAVSVDDAVWCGLCHPEYQITS